MRVAVTSEHRFARTPDGAVWTTGVNSYEFWTRYLAVFERVKVVARVKDVDNAEPAWRRADGPQVEFAAVPDYLGPWQFLARALQTIRAVHAAIDDRDAVIMRVGSHLAGCLEPKLVRSGHPFGLEVVNDPYDVFAPGAVQYKLRPLFRWWFTRQLRRQCSRAAGVAYVTETALQQRYPNQAYSVGMSDVEISNDTILTSPSVFTTHYSSVELAKEDAVDTCRSECNRNKRFRLVSVASLSQMYKAPDVLIRAVKQCIIAGFDVTLNIVGDGKHRPGLERLAAELGLADRVFFTGQLPAGAAVRSQLDQSDLFVLPSRCEGLPRAMVEAMARSLPCIGSAVGGIPELLPQEDMVRPGDVNGLAAKIQDVLSSPARMTKMSARNLEKAREYRDEVLAARRRAFFEHVRRVTATWQTARSSRPIENYGIRRSSAVHRLIRFQIRLSYVFDRLLPAAFRIDGNREFLESVVPENVKPGTVVYDVGGGKNPVISPEQKAKLGVRVVGVDIDAAELAAAPAGSYDQTACADITAYRGEGDGDLVICQALLEHVRDTDAAFRTISSILKPGGHAIVFVPSRNAVYARLNLLLPEALKRWVLFAIFPEMQGDHGFRAFYHYCTPAGFGRISGQHQLVTEDRRLYFQSDYFRFCFPLHALWRIWTMLFRLAAGPAAAETFTLILRKA